jgi:3-deoxy-manno-octulosonate cytidylyltransferase (CMP-KDO synthetase)
VTAIVAIIPARFASTRFPGKMLADRTGKPLIQHVYEQVKRCGSIARVMVATDDQRVLDAVERFGGDVVMTRPDHPNGSSRLAEVAASIDDDVIVNVQGDEPEIEPQVIEVAIDALQRNPHAVVATVASPFAPGEDPLNPNIVKVVMDRQGRALYFSRALIPFDRDADSNSHAIADRSGPLKHIGLYVYRREFLLKYVTLPPTPLEQIEQLEQLRVLEHGYTMAVALANVTTYGIDTPEQYDAFVRRHHARSAASR